MLGDDLPHVLRAGEIDLDGKGGVRSGVRLRGLRGLDRLLSRLAGGAGGIEGLAGGAVAAPGGGIGSGGNALTSCSPNTTTSGSMLPGVRPAVPS